MTALEERDIKEFVELKSYREDAAYSISINYEKSLADTLGNNAVDFVNKAERIIKDTSNIGLPLEHKT